MALKQEPATITPRVKREGDNEDPTRRVSQRTETAGTTEDDPKAIIRKIINKDLRSSDEAILTRAITELEHVFCSENQNQALLPVQGEFLLLGGYNTVVTLLDDAVSR